VELKTIQDKRAIDALPPHELAELYAWLDRHRPLNEAQLGMAVSNKGLAYSAARKMRR